MKVTTPFYVSVEVYGGLEQRGGLPLSSSRFESQGMWRGSHSGFGGGDGAPSAIDYPSYQYAEPAPAFGFALETQRPELRPRPLRLPARLQHRRRHDDAVPGPDSAATTSSTAPADLAGAARICGRHQQGQPRRLEGRLQLRSLQSAGRHLVRGRRGLSRSSRVTVGADIDYYVPTFDADSIWNWFTHGPITTITGRASRRLHAALLVAANGGVRMWTTDGDPTPRSGGRAVGAGECKVDLQLRDVRRRSERPGATVPFARDEANRNLIRPPTFSATSRAAIASAIGRRLGLARHAGDGRARETRRRRRRRARSAHGRPLRARRARLALRLGRPARPDRDATSFGYVLGAACSRPRSRTSSSSGSTTSTGSWASASGRSRS